MRSLGFSFLILTCLSTISAAQSPELDTLKPLAAVKVHTSSGTFHGSWIHQRDSSIVVQNEGIRRVIPLASVDSVQRFLVNDRTNRTAMIVGAVIGAAALAFVSNGFCTYECTRRNTAMAGIGAVIGAVVGRTVGGVATSISGEWVTFYRRT